MPTSRRLGGARARWIAGFLLLALSLYAYVTHWYNAHDQQILASVHISPHLVLRARRESPSDQAIPADAAVLRVMTFNVRYGTAFDGRDSWPHRSAHVADIIQRARPMVLGTQEGLSAQLAELQALLPTEYARIGEPRARDDEHVQVFYDTSAVRCLESGTFWLAETPQTKGWDAHHVRIATWGRFRTLRQDQEEEEEEEGDAVDSRGEREFFVFNTQLDAYGSIARIEGSKLLWRRMQEITQNADPKTPIVLLGDFNTLRSTDVYAFLTSGSPGPAFADAWMTAEQAIGNVSNTFHAFQGPKYDTALHSDWIPRAIDRPWIPGANHIDWILVRPHLRVLSVHVITEARQGRFPSDHYPVQADIVLDASS